MPGFVGKISGGLLQPNLERSGRNLSFQSNGLSTLFLDVNNQWLGFGTDIPTRTVLVNGNTKTTNFILDDVGEIADLTYVGSTNEVRNYTGNINISPSGPDPKFIADAFGTSSLRFDNNRLSTHVSNESIELKSNGTGKVNLRADTFIDADLHVTGDVTFDGDLILGNDNNDNVAFGADIATDILPDADLTYNLGSATQRWGYVYNYLVNGQVINANEIVSNGIGFGARQGNIWYVATNGSDTNVGDHPNGPFASVGEAVSRASAGDTIFIYPGTYQEAIPLTVPAGVTVKGADIRNTIIVPDSNTAEDVFLLNGECTIEDITIKDFTYDSINNKGHAFRFAPGFKVTTRSPYIRNVTIITTGSLTSVYDPRGYLSGDAGRGGYFDGSVVDPLSKNASVLFHSATFICPGTNCLTMTNGVRVEWLNSFIYFALRGLYAVSGSTGFAGDGKTRLKIYGMTATTVTAGMTVTLRDAGSTLTSGVIESITYSAPYAYVVIDGKIENWITTSAPPDSSVQQDVEFSNGVTATHIVNADWSDFGAEIRSIASANVYGNYGAIADGLGTLMYLIGHNFAYIGSEYNSENDATISIESHQAVEANDGKIYFQSTDHRGNFRVGDQFKVEESTGRIIFNLQLDTTGNTSFLFETEGGRTYVDATMIETGNIRISNNTISSLTGPINLIPFNGEIAITSNVNQTGNRQTNGYISVSDNSILGYDLLDSVIISATHNQTWYPVPDSQRSLGQFSQRWLNTYTRNLQLDSIQIQGNLIKTLNSNETLEISGLGTGRVLFEQTLSIRDATISNILSSPTESAGSININPNGIGSVLISGTNALQLPSGSATDRPMVILGELRYNTTSQTIEGFSTRGTTSMYALYDSDRQTYITPELTPGFNDNIIRMAAGGAVQSYFTGTDLVSNSFTGGVVNFNNNLVQSTVSNSDLELIAKGTGVVVAQDFHLYDGSIDVVTTDTNVEFLHNAEGYTKIVASALKIPYSDTADRHPTPEVGMHRYNTDLGYLEVWNGSTWIPSTGTSPQATAAEMDELTNIYTLVLG